MRAIAGLIGTSFRVAPVAAAACLCETLGVLLHLLQPLLLAGLVGATVRHDRGAVLATVAALLLSFVLARVAVLVGMNARAGQLERVGYAFDTRIGELAASMPTVDHLDDPTYMDQIQILREQSGVLGLAVNTLLNTLNCGVGTVGVIVLAAGADPRMLLVAAAGLPGVLCTALLIRWQARAERAAAEPGRLVTHLLQVGTTAAGAGEVRVFGLADPLRRRLAAAARAWTAPRVAVAARETAILLGAQLLFYGVAAAVLGWLVTDALHGAVSITAVTLALLLVTGLQEVGGNLRTVVTNLATTARTAGRFRWLVTTEARYRSAFPGTAEPTGAGVRLRGVGYTYPTAPGPALIDLDLDLPAGEIVALVGENGSGKSTLVELITGLRRPGRGRITVGDRELADLDLAAWRARLAGAFQDHLRLEFPAGDVVGVGDRPARHDRHRLNRAALAGGAEPVIARLPQGWATQLGASWPGGVEPSGGQWQRLAIARGMMRTAPLVRVLDEPTAALDATTEHQLFDRYVAAARAGRTTGTITILVTHRFSTVAAADRIVVLHGGRIIEVGTHGELLARGGHYAQLYALQARGYQ